MSGLAGKAIVLTVSRFANYGLMLISPIILVRLLSVEDFGRYREFVLYAAVLVSIAGFSIAESLLYLVPKFPQQPWRAVSQTVRLTVVSSVLVMGVVAVADLALEGRVSSGFFLPLLIYVLAFVNLDFWEFYWLSHHRSTAVFAYTVGRLAARMVTVTVAAWLSGDVDTIVWALVGLEVTRLAISALVWRRLSRARDEPQAAGLWQEQLKYCVPTGFATLLFTLHRNLGGLVVARMLGSTPLAFFSIGLYVEPIIVALRNSISTVALPEMVRSGDGQRMLSLWKRTVVFNALLLFPVAAFGAVYAGRFVLPVFGADYAPSVPVLQIYLMAIILECCDFAPALRAKNETRPLVLGGVIAVVTCGAALWALVPLHGIVGAAAALVVAALLDQVYLAVSVSRLYGTSLRRLIPWASLARVALAAAGSLGVYALDPWLGVLGLVGAVIAGVFYVVLYVILLKVLNVAEAISLLQRILQRLGVMAWR